MSNWWNNLSAKEKRQYIRDHPNSKYAKFGAGVSGPVKSKRMWRKGGSSFRSKLRNAAALTTAVGVTALAYARENAPPLSTLSDISEW